MPVDLKELERMFEEERMRNGGLPKGSPSPSPAVAYDHSAAPPNPATNAPVSTANPYQNYEDMFNAERASTYQKTKNSMTESNLSRMPEVHLYDEVQRPDRRLEMNDIPERTLAHTPYPLTSKLLRFGINAADAVSFGKLKPYLQEKALDDDSFIGRNLNETVGEAVRPSRNGLEKGLTVGGQITGMIGGAEAAYATGGKAIMKVAPKIASKIPTRVVSYLTRAAEQLGIHAPTAASTITRGIGAGLAYGATREGVEAASGESQPLSGRAKDVGMDALMFGAGDAAFGAVGHEISPYVKKFSDQRNLNSAINDFTKRTDPNKVNIMDNPEIIRDYRTEYPNRNALATGGKSYVDPKASQAARDTRVGVLENEARAKAQAQADEAARQAQEAQAAKRVPKPQEVPSYDMSPDIERPKLDRNLSGAAPKYGQHNTQFESDVDKALYIVAKQATSSKSHDKYMDFLRQSFPELDDTTIRGHAAEVVKEMGEYAKVAKADGMDTVVFPDSNRWRPKTAAPADKISSFTPTHKIKDGANGGGTPVEVIYNDNNTRAFYQSADGRISGEIPAGNVGSMMDKVSEQHAGYEHPDDMALAHEIFAKEEGVPLPKKVLPPEVAQSYKDTLKEMNPDPRKAEYEQQLKDLTGQNTGPVPPPIHADNAEQVVNDLMKRAKTDPKAAEDLRSFIRAMDEISRGKGETSAGFDDSFEKEMSLDELFAKAEEAKKSLRSFQDEMNQKYRYRDDLMTPDEATKAKSLKKENLTARTDAEYLRRELQAGRDEQTAGMDGGDKFSGKERIARRAETTSEAVRHQAREAFRRHADESYQRLKAMADDQTMTEEQVAQTPDLIRHFTNKGELDKVADIVERLDIAAANSGRGLNVWKLLSFTNEAGALRIAQRIHRKNGGSGQLPHETITNIQNQVRKMKNAEPTKSQGDTINDIMYRTPDEKAALDSTDRKHEIQNLEGVKTYLKNEKSKLKQATDKVKKDDAPPRERKRDKLVEEYKQAKEEVKKNDKNTLSANPFGAWSKIARYHVVNGAVKIADFSAKMASDGMDMTKDTWKKLYVHTISEHNKARGQKIRNYEKALDAAMAGSPLTKEERLDFRMLGKEITQLAKKDREAAMEQLQLEFAEFHKATGAEKIASFHTLVMLLNPITHIKNISSGPAMLAYDSLVKAIMVPLVDIPRAIVGKERQLVWKTNTKMNYWENFVKGGRAGWKGFSPDGFNTQYDLMGHSFAGAVKDGRFKKVRQLVQTSVHFMEKANYAAMKSFDYATAMTAVNKTMGETATMLAHAKVKDGSLARGDVKKWVEDYIDRNYDEMLDTHRKYGEVMTFQDTNELTKASVKLKRGLNSVNKIFGLPTDFGLGDVANKFPRTPANLLMRSIDMSPIGLVRSSYQITASLVGAAVKKDGRVVMTRDAQMALGRAMVGTAGTAMAFKLADLGILSGNVSKDRKEEGADNMSGFPAYSVNVSALTRYITSLDNKQAAPKKNDTVLGYEWFQPFSMLTSVASTYQENGGKLNSTKGMVDGLGGATGAALDQSFLQGTVKMASLSQGETPLDKAANIAASIPASFVPSSVNLVRRLADNDKREVEYYGGAKGILKGAKEQVQNKIPFWSKSLDQKKDYLGGNMEYYKDTNMAANVGKALSPSPISKYNPSSTMEKLNKIKAETGSSKVLPTQPSKQYTIKGVDHEFTKDQFSRYNALVDEYTTKGVNSLRDTGKTEDRIKRASAALTKARDNAREKVIKEYKLK